MGMPAAEQKVWTVEDVERLRDEQDARPDGERVRYEVVDGELLVSPAARPDHQQAVQLLYPRLYPYAERHRIGWVVIVTSDVHFDRLSAVQPDLVVFPLVDGRRIREWKGAPLPRLVVEVLSPSTARYDRVKKRARYQRAGVPEYWIVDLDSRLVERWRPEDERPEILGGRLAWQPEGAPEPLVIDLEAYFAEVWDEG